MLASGNINFICNPGFVYMDDSDKYRKVSKGGGEGRRDWGLNTKSDF